MARSGWGSFGFRGKPHRCPLVSQAHKKLLLDQFCQQAAQGSWIDDVEAEQGGADEFHGVTVTLHHQIGYPLEGWMAKQDCACFRIHRLAHAPQLIRQRQRLRNSRRPPALRACRVC